MGSLSEIIKNQKIELEKNAYKIGKTVKGIKAMFPAKNGKEETGVVVYKRKAEYRFNA